MIRGRHNATQKRHRCKSQFELPSLNYLSTNSVKVRYKVLQIGYFRKSGKSGKFDQAKNYLSTDAIFLQYTSTCCKRVYHEILLVSFATSSWNKGLAISSGAVHLDQGAGINGNYWTWSNLQIDAPPLGLQTILRFSFELHQHIGDHQNLHRLD